MEATGLTQEQMDSIVHYINGDEGAKMNESIVATFDMLYLKLHKRIMLNLIAEEKKNTRLNVKVAKMEEKRNSQKTADTNGEGFGCTGLDSADVAGCLTWELQNILQKGVSKSRMLKILYLMYATWLATKKERLFLEHPVATERGPIFWRAYKKINTEVNIDASYHTRMASQNPGVAVFARNAARKYYDMNEKDLEEYIKSGEPYKNALPGPDGKWCRQLSDNDIFLWRTKHDE